MKQAMCEYSRRPHGKRCTNKPVTFESASQLPCIVSLGSCCRVSRSSLQPQPLLCICCSDQQIPTVLFFCSVTHWSVALHSHTCTHTHSSTCFPSPTPSPAHWLFWSCQHFCSSLLLHSPHPALLLAKKKTKPPSPLLPAHYRLSYNTKRFFPHSPIFSVFQRVTLSLYVSVLSPFISKVYIFNCIVSLYLYIICKPVLT